MGLSSRRNGSSSACLYVDADRFFFSQQRNRQDCPVAHAQRKRLTLRKLIGRGSKVVHMDSSPIQDRPPGRPGSGERVLHEINRDPAVMRAEYQ